MFRIKVIHHVNVQISDRERARDWYTKVLGAEFLDRGPALNRRQLQLRLGSSEIHFTERPQPATIPSSHFALEVEGDSMVEAGILDGDTVIIQRTETADSGTIVVALVDNEEVTLNVALGLILILAGVALGSGVGGRLWRRGRAAEPEPEPATPPA